MDICLYAEHYNESICGFQSEFYMQIEKSYLYFYAISTIGGCGGKVGVSVPAWKGQSAGIAVLP